MRYALLQARNAGDPAQADERRAFSARLGVPEEQVQCVDILHDTLDASIVESSDALLVGGAGEYSILDPVPEIGGFIEFLAGEAEAGTPIFASCFGFHALVVGLGGEVTTMEDRAEVGTYTLELTPAGQEDPLFKALPNPFLAQLGHKDHATRLPSSKAALARSELTDVQAVRLIGKPVYATQFHPELTWLDNRRRFEGYMEQYGRLFGEDEAIRKLEGHRPGPEANALLSRFADMFLGGA